MKFVNINVLQGARLRAFRLSYDMKQHVVADALGISQQAVSKLEQGYVSFSDKMVTEICKLFKIRKSSFKVNLKNLVPDKKKEQRILRGKPLQREILFTSMLIELRKSRNEIKALKSEIGKTNEKSLSCKTIAKNSSVELIKGKKQK